MLGGSAAITTVTPTAASAFPNMQWVHSEGVQAGIHMTRVLFRRNRRNRSNSRIAVGGIMTGSMEVVAIIQELLNGEAGDSQREDVVHFSLLSGLSMPHIALVA